MKRKLAWIPLHHRDMRLATSHLSGDAFGAYMRLFMQACDRFGVLPLNEEELRRLCSNTKAEWRKVRDQVLEFFVHTPEGYVHTWLRGELDKAAALIETRSEAGTRAVTARWQAHSQKLDTENLSKQSLKSEPDLCEINDLAIRNVYDSDTHLHKNKEREENESSGLLAIDTVEVDLLGAVSAPEPKPARAKKPQMTAAEIDAAFSEFWSAYPRKDGRFMARAEYGKAIKSGVTPTELLAAVRAYPFKHDCYDKHAKNWLNGRVWQDQPNPHQGVASGSKAVHKPSKSDWARPGRPNDDFIETTYVEIP